MVEQQPGTEALTAYEQQIEVALEHVESAWLAIATNLRAIHDAGLYKDQYGTWARYCQERWGRQRRWAYQLLEAARVAENVRDRAHDVPPPTAEWQIRPLAGLPPDEQAAVWREAVERYEEPTGLEVEEIVAERQERAMITADADLGAYWDEDEEVDLAAVRANPEGFVQATSNLANAYGEETAEKLLAATSRALASVAQTQEPTLAPHQLIHSSKSNEWYTPALYIEAARELMGAIDLDPASCQDANDTVRAHRYFTREEDGLVQEWCGQNRMAVSVWLNPPYGRTAGESNAALWITKLLAEYEAGHVTEAVLLVNAVTERAWFQPLLDFPICFTNHRIRFQGANPDDDQPTHGNAFVYLGTDPDRFKRLFSQFGTIVRKV